MITSKEIGWLAGILEGEGCFRCNSSNSAIIQLQMTDEDVIIRARDLMRADAKISSRVRDAFSKRVYQLHIYGTTAAQWMMTIYPLMSKRRQAKIREVLASWRACRNRGRRAA